MIRRILRWFVRFIFSLLSDVKVIGMENVPMQGGLLMATNHLSRIDPPLIFYLLPREDARALVADSYRKNPFMRLVVNVANGIWINRDDADFGALRAARTHLQAGGLLGVAPEGTRSRTRAMLPAKTGIAYLADKARVPVLPAAISGTETAFDELFRLRRPQITIQFGDPITLPPVDRQNREACLQRNTDEIMCRIASMLPSHYWGAYAGHPRLGELLANPLSPIPECKQVALLGQPVST